MYYYSNVKGVEVMKRTILSILLVSLCLTFVFCGCGGEKAEKPAAKAEKPAPAPAPAPAAAGEVVTRDIAVYDVLEANWDWGRSGYHDETGTFAHYYGGDTDGFFTYEFEGAPNVTAVEIKARMSAEADNYEEPSETSNVTIYINDVKVDSEHIMYDDFKGKIYTFKSTDPAVLKAIKPGEGNVLKFAVDKDAQNKHGICIYGEALTDEAKSEAIPVIVKMTVKK
jgi:hypothetical protein